jgi:hypothetical protein
MKRNLARWHVLLLAILLLGLLPLTSCSLLGTQSSSSFCDAGDSDLNYTDTGKEFMKYSVFRFDTTTSSHSLTIPSASDIMSALSSQGVGQVVVFAVTADGSNAVTVTGGTGVTVKQSASTVAGNTTQLIYCVVDSTSSGDKRMTAY